MKSLFEQFGGTYRKENAFVEIDKQAQERFFRIVEQIKQERGITELLKIISPIKWTQLMNCVRHQADEIIFAELIFN